MAAHKVGGGSAVPIDFVTDGVRRSTLAARDAVWEHTAAAAAPNAGGNNARTFFRIGGDGKWQFCVMFPTGSIQVLSTEP